MLCMARVLLATALFVVMGTRAFGQPQYAHFWLSTSASDPDVPLATPTIGIGNGVQGTLYVWGRPHQIDPNLYHWLSNVSLNLITDAVDSSPYVIDFLNVQIDVFNEELNPRRYEYDRDSTEQLCDIGAGEFPCIEAMTSEIAPPLTDEEDKILNFGGYSSTPPSEQLEPTPGIGGYVAECIEANLCFLDDDSQPAWLIASVGYQALESGQTELFLQIGEPGMNHLGRPVNETFARFGIASDPLYNALSDKEMTFTLDTPDAVIVSSPTGDFDNNGVVDGADLGIWQSLYGSADVGFYGGNGNGVVDGRDFLLWQRAYGSAGALFDQIKSVPEPATSALAALVILSLFATQRMRAAPSLSLTTAAVRPVSLAVLLMAIVVEPSHVQGAGVEFVLKQTFHNPSGPLLGDKFGEATAVLGDNLLSKSNRANVGAGSVVLLDSDNGGLLQTFQDPSVSAGDAFGQHIVANADGSRVLINAFRQAEGADKGVGAAYLFNTVDGSLVQRIADPDPQPQDNFGGSLALVGNDFAVYAAQKDVDLDGNMSIQTNEGNIGLVYIFDDDGNSLREFESPDQDRDDRFGGRGGPTGTNPNHLLIGERLGDQTAENAGSAYLYDISTGQLLETFGSDDPMLNDSFGVKIPHRGITNANIAVVGADRGGSTGFETGSIYVYEFDANPLTEPTLLATITNPNPIPGNRFFGEVEVTNDYVFVGSFQDDTSANDAGVVHIFDLHTGILKDTLQHPDPHSGDEFGYWLTTRSDGVFISALRDDVDGILDAGSVFFYQIRELVEWTGTAGDWASGTNWDTGVAPVSTANEVAVIANGGTATISSAAADVLAMKIEAGEVSVESGGSITVLDDTKISSSGTLTVDGASSQLTSQLMNVSGLLSVADGGTVTVNDALLLELGGQADLSGGGLNATSTSVQGGILSGTGVVTGEVTVETGGILDAGDSGVLQIVGELTNFDSVSDVLTGGAYAVTGTLKFDDAHLVTNEANVSLSGSSSAIKDESDADALADFAANASGASFTLLNDRDLSVTGSFTNAGAMTLKNGSRLTVNGTYSQTGGVTELGSGTSTDVGELEATSINLQGGLLRGNGAVLGNITNAAAVAPGFSPGIIEVDGDYTQTSAGVLDVEIGGTTTAGTDFDQLQVTGTATLAGRLEVSLINGYDTMAMEDDEIPILTAASVVDTFDSFLLFNPPSGLATELVYGSADVKVKFVPPEDIVYEPPAMPAGDDLWSTSGVWDLGTSPVSKNNATIRSDSMDRRLEIDVPFAYANRATVSGPTNTMTLEIPTGTTLSAINSLTIDDNGVLEMAGGTAIGNNVTVEVGGTILGSGAIVGDLVNSGTLSPGFSTGELNIDGDGTLTSSSTVVLEIDGTGSGQFDTINFSGDLSLGGDLVIDLTDMPTFNPGDRVELITTDSLMTGTTFDDILTMGTSESLIVLSISEETVSAFSAGAGDLNLNEIPGDDGDFPLLAMALANYDSYAEYMMFAFCPGRCLSDATPENLKGVANVNGDMEELINFDDVLALAVVGGLSVQQALELMYATTSVPEPSTFILALALIPMMFARGRP